MKKRLVRIILVALGFFLCTTNVEAMTLPKSYSTTNGITYTLESFSVNIYDGSVGDNNIPNYFTGDKNLLYTIPVSIPDNQLSLNPEETVLNDEGSMGSYIDLNVNIGPELIEKMVKEQIPTINNGDSYYVELVVNYQIDDMPQIYKSMNRLNILEFVFSTLSSGITPVTLNTPTSQILEITKYSKENDVEEFVSGIDVLEGIEGSSMTESDTGVSLGMADYLAFSDTDLGSTENINNGYILMFHNSDEVTNAILNPSDENQSNSTLENEQEPTEIVKTGNTSMNVATVVYVFSGILVVLGVGFIAISRSRKIF